MKIAIGSDHRGTDAVRRLVTDLEKLGHEPLVCGPSGSEPSDYPDSAYHVGQTVACGEAERGILICGSGIGICIAANKVHGIRAALVFDDHAAEMTRRHNDANVLCMSGDKLSHDEIDRIVRIWLTTDFEGGRHERRVKKIAAIERGVDPTTINNANNANV